MDTNKIKPQALVAIVNDNNDAHKDAAELLRKAAGDMQTSIAFLQQDVAVGRRAIAEMRILHEAAGLDPDAVTIKEAAKIIARFRKLAMRNVAVRSENRFMAMALGLFAAGVLIVA